MTLEELIDAERRAIDSAVPGFSQARKNRLYHKMRLFSCASQKADLPNDVSISDAWLQLILRAKDIAGITRSEEYYLTRKQRGLKPLNFDL